jgi:galactokinase/mevalonate kinase-like predicted kinase
MENIRQQLLIRWKIKRKLHRRLTQHTINRLYMARYK